MENLGEIVEFEESKTRSEEGILRSLRTCVQKHVAILVVRFLTPREPLVVAVSHSGWVGEGGGGTGK